MEFFVAPIVFAILATLASRRVEPRALIVLGVFWVTALTTWTLASVPGPEVSLHDFERNSGPVLLATLAGTAAAVAFAIRMRTASLPLALVSVAVMYFLSSIVVGVVATFWYTG